MNEELKICLWVPLGIALLNVVLSQIHPLVLLIGSLATIYLWTTFLLTKIDNTNE